MEIRFYNNTSPNNKVTKNLTNETILTGTLREECSISTPAFNISDLDPIFNYCFIPDFNRYYFITNMTYVRNNLYRIDLSVDVLMSFKDDILAQKAVIERNEKLFNLYLGDSSYSQYSYVKTQTKRFPNAFSDKGEYILVVAGNKHLEE